MTETRKKILEKVVDPNESGLDRLQVMYSFDEYGEFSPEISVAQTGFYMGLTLGGVFGAGSAAK
jgi:hypothetical protein